MCLIHKTASGSSDVHLTLACVSYIRQHQVAVMYISWIEEDKQDEDLPYSVIGVNNTKHKHDLVNESEFELNYNMGIAYIVAVAVCLIISFIKIVRK